MNDSEASMKSMPSLEKNRLNKRELSKMPTSDAVKSKQRKLLGEPRSSEPL